MQKKEGKIKTKEEIEFEKKWGKVCPVCHLRKGTFMASRGAEGGKDSVCNCELAIKEKEC